DGRLLTRSYSTRTRTLRTADSLTVPTFGERVSMVPQTSSSYWYLARKRSSLMTPYFRVRQISVGHGFEKKHGSHARTFMDPRIFGEPCFSRGFCSMKCGSEARFSSTARRTKCKYPVLNSPILTFSIIYRSRAFCGQIMKSIFILTTIKQELGFLFSFCST